MTNSMRIAGLVVLAGAGVALAEPTPRMAGGPWGVGAWRTYEPQCFQDGREMDAAGNVGPTPDGRMVSGDPLDPGPAAVCFAEGYTPTAEEWQFIQRMMQGGYQSRYNADQRWPGVPGDPIALTWSFVPDGLITGGSGNQLASNLFATLDSQFAPFGGRATWKQQFQRVFDRWSVLSGIQYTFVSSGGNDWDDGAAWGAAGQPGARGDIRISMHNIDGGNGVLAYDTFPTSSDMVMDSSENWAQGAPSYIFMRNVVAHEHGHGLGFSHVCPANGTKLMEPFISTGYDGPQQDDIRAVQEFYGDSFEPNDTASTATDLGTPTPGQSYLYGLVPTPSAGSAATLSLSPGATVGSSDDDVDFYKITVDAPRLLTVTATPVGSSYVDVDQNSDGSCQTTGNTVNALTQANLVVTITTSFGTGILRSSDVNPAGSSEQISNLLLNQGVNLIKVSSSQAMSETQLYRLLFNVGTDTFAPTASDGTFTDGVHISWPAIPDATAYAVNRYTSDVFGLSAQIATNLAPGSTSYVDTTATPGQVYYYWVRAQQPGSTAYRYITQAGEQGSRGVPNQNPVADAGPDITVTDSDNNGTELVTLDGSASHDPDGTITLYTWTEGAGTLASIASPTTNVNFGVGVHTVQLRVTDNAGGTGTDTVIVTVLAGGPTCDPDVNQDGVADQGDVDYLINVIAGGQNPTGIDADFNGDGVADQGDIDALVNVIAGGPCP